MSDVLSSPLLLVIDVGNTNTVFGLYEEDSLVADFRVETRRNRTGDEYYTLLEPLIRRSGYVLGDVKEVVVSSVVPRSFYPLSRMSRAITGKDPVTVDHVMDVGLTLKIHRPEEMGADRLVNAAAAYRQYGGCVVVDFGTATTFDVVSGGGEYLGGCITPGVSISTDALSAYASSLPSIARIRLRSALDAMWSGCFSRTIRKRL